jgi:Nuclease-related domain
MVPPVAAESTKSKAEKRIFALLRDVDLGASATALHSLNLSEHDYKLVGELDFLLITHRGIYVLEVKGGRVRRGQNDSIWTYTDRYGCDHRNSEGPFEQARSGMFALRDRLQEEFGAQLDALAFGYGVVFPDFEFRHESVEWADAMVFDERHVISADAFGHGLRRFIAYWEGKHKKNVPLAPDLLGRVRQFVRPGFDRVPSLRSRTRGINEAMERLTEEQYHQIDFVEENPRVLFSGGAGTGKTFIAAEVARRHAAKGQRVLLTCESPVLAAYLRTRVQSPLVDVRPVAGIVTEEARYDTVVADEGQDILNLDTLAKLDAVLKGGLEQGSWRIFYDANKQSGLVGRMEPEALDLLRSCGAPTGRLTRNCRNTHEIVVQTKLLTAGDLGTPSAGHGPPVRYAYPGTTAEQAAVLDAEIRRLREEGVEPGQITILSSVGVENSCVARTEARRKGQITALTPIVASAWPTQGLTFARVPDFKGLENDFILLVDLDEAIADPAAQNVLYVAMSRARTALWISVGGAAKKHLEQVSKDNLAKILNDPQTARDLEVR